MPGLQVKVIAVGGAVRTVPMPDGFLFADLSTGRCGACAGTGRREFPMPERHPRRNPAIRPRDCHDCNGTGDAHVHEGSRIAAMLDAARERTAERHETVELFTPAPALDARSAHDGGMSGMYSPGALRAIAEEIEALKRVRNHAELLANAVLEECLHPDAADAAEMIERAETLKNRIARADTAAEYDRESDQTVDAVLEIQGAQQRRRFA